MLRRVGLGRRNHLRIVRCQPVIDRAFEQLAAQPDVIRIHVRLLRKGHAGQLFVRALAQPHANPVGDKLLDVGLRAVEIRLDHNPDGAPHPRLRVNSPHNVQGDLCERGVFHVDADKRAYMARVLRQLPGNVFRQLGLQFQPHLRQLHTHVRAQLVRRNLVEQAVIDIGGTARFGLGRDTLAQGIERHRDSLPVHGLGHAQRVLDLQARHKTRAEFGSYTGSAHRSGADCDCGRER